MNNSKLFMLVMALFIMSASGCSTTSQKKSQLPQTIAVASTNKVETLVESQQGNGFGGTGRMPTQVAQVDELLNRAMLRHTTILDNGFGGTGQTAFGFGGTGFIGTVDKFGSIWVNGIEVGLGQKTRILSNIPALSEDLTVEDLRIGQQVWFETLPDQEKTTTAVIHIFYPLAGQIESIETLDMVTALVVNGRRVYLNADTVIPDTVQLEVGDSVRISGVPVFTKTRSKENQAINSTDLILQRSDAWQATLVEPSAPGIVWSASVPNVSFSNQVNRLIMHPSWSSSYQIGEFTNLDKGLAEFPKIEMEGSKPAAPQPQK